MRSDEIALWIRNMLYSTYIEMRYHLFSSRMLIAVVILSFSMIAGSYGLSALAIQPDATILPEDLKGMKSTFVLYLVSFMVAMFGSLAMLILSFDAFSRDRENGSIEVILSRPVTKRMYALSKYIGLNLALAIYLLPLLISSINIVSEVTGENVPTVIMWWYIAITLALFSAISLIQMVISLMAKNMGSAIMYGLSVWFIYTIFWLLVSLTLAQYMGLHPSQGQSVEDFTSTMEFSYISNRVDLFNPIGAFHLCTGILLAPKDEVITVPHLWPYLSLALWNIVLLIIMVEVFNRQERMG